MSRPNQMQLSACMSKFKYGVLYCNDRWRYCSDSCDNVRISQSGANGTTAVSELPRATLSNTTMWDRTGQSSGHMRSIVQTRVLWVKEVNVPLCFNIFRLNFSRKRSQVYTVLPNDAPRGGLLIWRIVNTLTSHPILLPLTSSRVLFLTSSLARSHVHIWKVVMFFFLATPQSTASRVCHLCVIRASLRSWGALEHSDSSALKSGGIGGITAVAAVIPREWM